MQQILIEDAGYFAHCATRPTTERVVAGFPRNDAEAGKSNPLEACLLLTEVAVSSKLIHCQSFKDGCGPATSRHDLPKVAVVHLGT